MATYEQIMEGPWVNSTVFPESIPHLLHYDLAFLWVLEKQDDQRPTIWDERLSAWRCLVTLLLTGELEIKEEPIREPLLRYTEKFGIDRVSWLSVRNDATKIGVLSPTVLVRPLPDFTTANLKGWEEVLKQNPRPDELRFFVELAIRELQQGQSGHSFRNKLARILAKEFLGLDSSRRGVATQSLSVAPAGTIGSPLQVPLLRHLLWGRKPGETSCLEVVELSIRGNRVILGRSYIPRCDSCAHLLTKPREAPPLEASGDYIQVTCENPIDTHLNRLPLSNFLIWARDDSDVIVWKREGILDLPIEGLPPEPTIQGIQVEFEWNSAQLGGVEKQKRFLKIQFPQKKIVERKIDEILFRKILVPGKFANFSGLPIRPEWLDALESPDQVTCEATPMASKLVYRNMRVKGWPVPVSRTFSGSSMVHHEPGLAVGIYPDPLILPKDWQWYRIFLHGSKRRSYKMQMDSVKQILPWLSETTNGLRDQATDLEKSFSVLAPSDNNLGATFWVSDQHKELKPTVPARINLGIDFGTTNTLIYFLPPGKDLEHVKATPPEFCLEPSKSYLLVRWLAEVDSQQSKSVGDFLPGPEYRQDRLDPYIIPSDLWKFDDEFLIRWGSEPPHPQAGRRDGFKWDEGISRATERNAYMKELFLIALPSILKSAMDSGSITTWDLNFHLGFAYPLAFGGEDRQSAIVLHDWICAEMKKLTSFNFTSHSINESSACMILLGSPNTTDAFLVADMGGGTIDLALFTAKSPVADQIGSIKFAGENYLDVLTKKRGVPGQEVRDLIAQGKCHHHYGGDNVAQQVLDRFIGIAFEFLRTMIAAYRKQKPKQNIHLVLAGNGWHLVEAFSSQTKIMTANQVFGEYYQFLIDQLGDESVERSHPLPNLASNKHLVAIGALKQAATGGEELKATTPVASRLPSGRGLKFGGINKKGKCIRWNDLVGGRVPFSITSGDLLKADLHVDFDDMPPLPQEWRRYLLGFFGVGYEKDIPYANELKLREELRKAIPPGGPPTLTKGPLQITIEQRWLEWLKE